MHAAGVQLHAVLHEPCNSKCTKHFTQYFNGDIYIDDEKVFFGPQQRRLGVMGMLRFNLYSKVWSAKNKGVEGNMHGDGTLLGAVYVIGPGDMGILYEHREAEFGDYCNTSQVIHALDAIREYKVKNN